MGRILYINCSRGVFYLSLQPDDLSVIGNYTFSPTIRVNKHIAFIPLKKHTHTKKQELVANTPRGMNVKFGETELLFVHGATLQHIYIPHVLIVHLK